MMSLVEASSIFLFDVVISLYLLGLMLSPLFVLQLWGVRAAMHWVVTEFLIVLDVAIMAFLILRPALPLQFDPSALPLDGNGFLAVIARVFQLGFFWVIAVGVPAMAVVSGAALALLWAALAHALPISGGRRRD